MSDTIELSEVPLGSKIVVDGWTGLVMGRHPDGNHVVVSFRDNGIGKIVKDKQVEVVEWP